MLSISTLRTSLLVAAAALVSTTPAIAQVAFVPIDVMGTAMSGAMMDAAGARSNEIVRPSRKLAPTASATAIRSLAYSASSARTRANIAAFAKKSRAVDPKGAAAMEQLFASQDIMATVEGEMRKVGLTKNNMADAYTAWWTNAWLATEGRTDTLPREQMQAVKRQSVDALLAAPQIAALTDAQKQEFAEAMLVQAMLIGASTEAAAGDARQMAALRSAVLKGARASGLDLSAMTLTDEGFRPARGSDASDAPLPLGAVREKQADARRSDAGPNYLLMAAVGGAGFAGVSLLGKRSGRKG